MVAKCSNPACNRQFQQLSKGRLYLLPPTQNPFASWDGGRLSDYCYWLCPECDATHTLTRCGSEVVVNQREPRLADPAYAAPLRRKEPRQITLRSYTQAG
jgi:hypothetical protein